MNSLVATQDAVWANMQLVSSGAVKTLNYLLQNYHWLQDFEPQQTSAATVFSLCLFSFEPLCHMALIY